MEPANTWSIKTVKAVEIPQLVCLMLQTTAQLHLQGLCKWESTPSSPAGNQKGGKRKRLRGGKELHHLPEPHLFPGLGRGTAAGKQKGWPMERGEEGSYHLPLITASYQADSTSPKPHVGNSTAWFTSVWLELNQLCTYRAADQLQKPVSSLSKVITVQFQGNCLDTPRINRLIFSQ